MGGSAGDWVGGIGGSMLGGGLMGPLGNVLGGYLGSQGGGEGGGKNAKGGDAPASPDFAAIANAQGDASLRNTREQTSANRPDQYDAFGGSSTWAQGPDGRWTQRQSLGAGLQGTADTLMGQLSGNAQVNPAQARDQAIEAAYGQATSRLDPQWAQRQASLENQLANEGMTRGDEAWQTSAGNLGRERNDAYAQAMYNAQTGAGNAAFGQSLAANMQPYQQLQAIQGLSRPSPFTSAGAAQPPDLLAAAMQRYGADLNSYNANQANKNSKMNAGAGLGSAAMMAAAV
jgi:hypothetical protein